MKNLLALFLAGAVLVTASAFAQNDYPNPGIRAYREGKWLGSDHLYNVSDHIGVVAEVIVSADTPIPIQEQTVKEIVTKIFEKNAITPVAETSADDPGLPFFHVLLMISPIETGYVIFCTGRLFESVDIDRVVLPEDAILQGITWEKQNLVVASKADAGERARKCVESVTDYFVERFKFFEGLKERRKG